MNKVYDLIIIGTGPAGYTASIYASRYKINHIIIGKQSGGLVSESHKICNYPGLYNISGIELTQKFKQHTEKLGSKEINDIVTKIIKKNDTFQLITNTQKTYVTKTILLATGTTRRKLNLPREQELLGKGISYCATCDGGFFKDKIVTIVGGSDAANTASLYLSEIASQVIQIYRKDKLRGEPTWIEQISKNSKIKVTYNTNVIKYIGDAKLEGLELDNGKTIKTDGLFIEIGSVPDIELSNQLGLDLNNSYIKVNQAQQTNVNGVWAAGDITTGSNSFRQVITACSEGAIAANDIFQYLSRKK